MEALSNILRYAVVECKLAVVPANITYVLIVLAMAVRITNQKTNRGTAPSSEEVSGEMAVIFVEAGRNHSLMGNVDCEGSQRLTWQSEPAEPHGEFRYFASAEDFAVALLYLQSQPEDDVSMLLTDKSTPNMETKMDEGAKAEASSQTEWPDDHPSKNPQCSAAWPAIPQDHGQECYDQLIDSNDQCCIQGSEGGSMASKRCAETELEELVRELEIHSTELERRHLEMGKYIKDLQATLEFLQGLSTDLEHRKRTLDAHVQELVSYNRTLESRSLSLEKRNKELEIHLRDLGGVNLEFKRQCLENVGTSTQTDNRRLHVEPPCQVLSRNTPQNSETNGARTLVQEKGDEHLDSQQDRATSEVAELKLCNEKLKTENQQLERRVVELQMARTALMGQNFEYADSVLAAVGAADSVTENGSTKHST